METTSNNNNNQAKRQNYSVPPRRNNLLIITVVIALIAVAGFVIGGIVIHNKNQQYAELTQKKQALEDSTVNLTTNLSSRDSLVNEMMVAFDEIEQNLQQIKQKREMISSNSANPEFTKDKKEAIIKDIQMMNTLISDSKKKIAALNRKLKNSGIQLAELQKKVDAMNEIVDNQEQNIAMLKDSLSTRDYKLAELNEKMSQMEMNMNMQEAKIDSQRVNLHTAYYTSGSYKELKEKGVLTKEGGFLGLGQNTTLSSDVSPSDFTQIDMTKTDTIPVHSRKVELITEHPQGSYKLVENNGEISYLAIQNPSEFWKLSKYMVIETK